MEPAKESVKVKTPQFGNVAQGWNGLNEGEKMQMLIEADDPAEEHLFRRQAVGGDRIQPEGSCCPVLSGAHASFFEADFIFRIFATYLSCVMRMGSAG